MSNNFDVHNKRVQTGMKVVINKHPYLTGLPRLLETEDWVAKSVAP